MGQSQAYRFLRLKTWEERHIKTRQDYDLWEKYAVRSMGNFIDSKCIDTKCVRHAVVCQNLLHGI